MSSSEIPFKQEPNHDQQDGCDSTERASATTNLLDLMRKFLRRTEKASQPEAPPAGDQAESATILPLMKKAQETVGTTPRPNLTPGLCWPPTTAPGTEQKDTQPEPPEKTEKPAASEASRQAARTEETTGKIAAREKTLAPSWPPTTTPIQERAVSQPAAPRKQNQAAVKDLVELLQELVKRAEPPTRADETALRPLRRTEESPLPVELPQEPLEQAEEISPPPKPSGLVWPPTTSSTVADSDSSWNRPLEPTQATVWSLWDTAATPVRRQTREEDSPPGPPAADGEAVPLTVMPEAAPPPREKAIQEAGAQVELEEAPAAAVQVEPAPQVAEAEVPEEPASMTMAPQVAFPAADGEAAPLTVMPEAAPPQALEVVAPQVPAPAEPGEPMQPAAPGPEEAAVAATLPMPMGFRYTHTRTVPVDPQTMMRHRLISSGVEVEIVESYKLLRTHVLQKTQAQHRNVLMVTSPLPDEGKTLTAINLAISISRELAQTVLLVDLDLRSPSIHRYFGFEVDKGLIDYLEGRCTIPEVLVNPQGYDRLVILPGGRPTEWASELIRSPRMLSLVPELKGFYADRYVLFDLPPLLLFADALTFSPLVDGIIVVVAARTTLSTDLKRCQEMLKERPVLGYVFNKAELASRSRYYRYYEYAKKSLVGKFWQKKS